MKKTLLSLFLLASAGLSAQVTIFEDGFESYDDFVINQFGGWVSLDLDGLPTYIGGTDYEAGEWAPNWANSGDPMAFQIFNPSTADGTVVETGEIAPIFNDLTGASGETRNFDPHTGSKYAAAWAAVPDNDGDLNNDYLFTPVINLGASNNVVSFWVKALSPDYPENYRVVVYSGAGVPTPTSTFQTISGLQVQSAPYAAWTLRTYNIPASFANTSVRIGIRYVSEDSYMFMVDDVLVTSSNLGTNDVLASKFSVYPNPSNSVINISSSDAIAVSQIEITDLNGRVVKQNKFDAVTEAQVNVSDLSSGIYMMNITSPEGVAVKKIVRN